MKKVFLFLLIGDFVDRLFEDFHETGVDAAQDDVFDVGLLWDLFGFSELVEGLVDNVDILL